MEKYIDSIEQLNLGRRVAGGSCSDIYSFSDVLYFKMFNEDYRDLNDSINVEFYETVKYLSEISCMPFIIRGKDIYRSKSELFGYAMPIVQAEHLHDIADNVLIAEVISSLNVLNNDIRTLADNYVKTEDIGGDNIFYNGNMYLLDLDLSLVNRLYVPDELYLRTLHSVLCAIRGRVLGDERRDDIIKDGNYLDYFNQIKNICSESLGYEVKTVGEFRDAYQKIKNRYFN